MKKIKWICILFLFIIFPSLTVRANDIIDDYHTYVEIIMATGKLMRDFTKDDVIDVYEGMEGVHFYDIVIEPVNQNVHASYISNTLFSVENQSASDVEYDVDVKVETNNKITFSYDGGISAAAKGTINKVKAEASAKSNVGFNAQSARSVKESKSTKIVVEANSRAIIYLTGEMSITNGLIIVYRLFYKAYTGSYEFITLKSQYARIEKASL